jgi:hypothetical protein
MNQTKKVKKLVDTLMGVEEQVDLLRQDVAINGYGPAVGNSLSLLQRSLSVLAKDVDTMRNVWEMGDVQGESLHNLLPAVRADERKLP